MGAAVWFITGAAAFFGFVVVHEFGHALAARLVGVPGDAVAIRLTEWPAHVALKTDGQWHSPGTIEYERAYACHDPQLRWLGAFVAAGFVLQTSAAGVLTAVAHATGADDLAVRLVRISLVVNALYLLGDLAATIASRAPAGDMSSLLRHTPKAGLATLAVLAGGHAILLWLVA